MKQTELLESFRQRGLRCTSQRYAILQYLTQHPVHPTPEQICKAINRTDPRASRATVYKSLHALLDAGLVRELNPTGEAARYECRTDPHHHFICESCGKIEDLEWFDVPAVAKQQGNAPRRVRRWELNYYGQCGLCLSKQQ